jgi:hypothetical protein
MVIGYENSNIREFLHQPSEESSRLVPLPLQLFPGAPIWTPTDKDARLTQRRQQFAGHLCEILGLNGGADFYRQESEGAA